MVSLTVVKRKIQNGKNILAKPQQQKKKLKMFSYCCRENMLKIENYFFLNHILLFYKVAPTTILMAFDFYENIFHFKIFFVVEQTEKYCHTSFIRLLHGAFLNTKNINGFLSTRQQ